MCNSCLKKMRTLKINLNFNFWTVSNKAQTKNLQVTQVWKYQKITTYFPSTFHPCHRQPKWRIQLEKILEEIYGLFWKSLNCQITVEVHGLTCFEEFWIYVNVKNVAQTVYFHRKKTLCSSFRGKQDIFLWKKSWIRRFRIRENELQAS